MKAVTLELPWPPSVNHYWASSGRRRYVGPKGVAFREEVFWIVRRANGNGAFKDRRVAVSIGCHEPKLKRRRDLDNVLKASMDALRHAGVYNDDSQIDALLVERRAPDTGKGFLKVTIREWTPEPE
jgi:crossover junction endodeoxyribonuclease RusA